MAVSGVKRNRISSIKASCRWLALVSFALSACAGPAAVATEPATTTPIPATAAATLESSPAATATANPADLTKLQRPAGMAFDSDGNLYVADCQRNILNRDHNLILRFDQTGQVTVYAGEGPPGFSGDDGSALSARLYCPGDLAFDPAGNLYVADTLNFRIRRIDTNGIIRTIAGSGPGGTFIEPICCATYPLAGFAGDGGPATAAQLDAGSLAFDPDGNLYVGDASNDRVRKIDRQGIITTVVGKGTPGYSGDGGQAAEAELSIGPGLANPNVGMGIAFDAAGNLYIADFGNSRVRRVDRQGIITTIAGTGVPGFSGDGGPATAAQISAPIDLAFDAAGSLYIADLSPIGDEGTRVRKIDQNGIITTVAGGGAPALLADGVRATSVWLKGVSIIAIDPAGDLLIADGSNSRVRKVDQNGIITTVAGGGF
jgi:sugar lactone lactonase YvrE